MLSIAPPPPQYRALAARLTAGEFTHLFPHEYLITESVGLSAASRGIATAEVSTMRAPEGRAILGISAVLKREGANPYGSMITIGRARNNDICVDEASISKLHAWLRRRDDEHGAVRLTITDAGSRNGTFVDGLPVVGQPRELAFGARVRLGSVQFWLADGAMLYRCLRATLEAGSQAA